MFVAGFFEVVLHLFLAKIPMIANDESMNSMTSAHST